MLGHAETARSRTGGGGRDERARKANGVPHREQKKTKPASRQEFAQKTVCTHTYLGTGSAEFNCGNSRVTAPRPPLCYGTRPAAKNWQLQLGRGLTQVKQVKVGVVQAKGSPCLFRHEELDGRVVVHGDELWLMAHADGLTVLLPRVGPRYV